ncbi:hypothetical protein AB0M47_15545 [Hamadaea sp. NPDC051192]|uniref:hypothetical protein n=1 Tax=Hamadaea sp. NPDC051192 TaxID=3154940 RepID=UPI00342A3A7F
MSTVWAPAGQPDTSSYNPLWCAQSDRYLYVALEGPHPPSPEVVPGKVPKLSHIVIRGDSGWTPEDGFGSSGPANLRYLTTDRYLHAGFYTPPPADVRRLQIAFVDPDERPQFSTDYLRVSAAEPVSGTWQTRRPLPDGFQLLGAGCGKDVFYAYVEGPFDPAVELADPIEWQSTFRFPDDLPQPRPDAVYLSRTGSRQASTRATVMFRVPLGGRDPDAFTAHVTEPESGGLVLDLDAYRV